MRSFPISYASVALQRARVEIDSKADSGTDAGDL